jgi:AraC-like DNA-binding protein
MRDVPLPDVLIVEPDLTMVALAVLLRRVAHVRTTVSVSGGWHMFQQARPSVVILEAELPERESVLFLRSIRAESRSLPVVVLSPSGATETLEQLASQGIHGIFRAPIRLDLASAHVARLLGIHGVRLDPRVGAAIRVMAESYAHPVPARRLAAAIGLSAPHLARLFKTQTGLTIHEFVTALRIEIAKTCLDARRWSRAEIAHKIGFSSTAHFSRLFRRNVGVSFQAYRRRAG